MQDSNEKNGLNIKYFHDVKRAPDLRESIGQNQRPIFPGTAYPPYARPRRKSPCEKTPVFAFCCRAPRQGVFPDAAKGMRDIGFRVGEAEMKGLSDKWRTGISGGQSKDPSIEISLQIRTSLIPFPPASDPGPQQP